MSDNQNSQSQARLQKMKANLIEFGGDLLAIAKLFTNDLKLQPKPRAKMRGFKTMFNESFNKSGAGDFKSGFKSFKDDINAIKNKRYVKTEYKKVEEPKEAPPVSPKTNDKPREYWLDRLGLPAGATQDQARAAFHQAALKYHPDKNKSSWASQRFIELQEAWEHLK